MIREETRVAFIGTDNPLVKHEDQGVVLQKSGGGAHIKWDSGQITLEPVEDLFEIKDAGHTQAEQELDYALDLPGISPGIALSTFDEGGAEGLVDLLASVGQLDVYEDVVEAARESIATALGESHWIRDFDPDAKSEVCAILTGELLRRM